MQDHPIHVVSKDSAHPLRLGRARGELLSWATGLLAGLGTAEPERVCRILADYVDGMILHQLSTPAAQFDPASEIEAVMRALLGADSDGP